MFVKRKSHETKQAHNCQTQSLSPTHHVDQAQELIN